MTDDEGSIFDEDQFVVPPSKRGQASPAGTSAPPPRAAKVHAPEIHEFPSPRPSAPVRPGVSEPVDQAGSDEFERTTGTPRDELYKNDVRCVFIGPPQAGKTTVLGGILQACMQPPTSPDDYRLKLIAGGANTTDLVRETYARMMTSHGRMKATESTIRYDFNVRVTQPGTVWRPAVHEEARLVVQDGPGGALFSGEAAIHPDDALKQWEMQLLKESRAANCLVLCVDATQRDTGILLSQLTGRLKDLSDSTVGEAMPVFETWQQRTYSWITNLWRKQQRRREVWERWLAASRVLILLTKIDEVASAVVDESDHPMSAGALAAAIDPVKQACDLLSEGFLYQILCALDPRKRHTNGQVTGGLAVAVSSAWGFDRFTGAPLRAQGGTGQDIHSEVARLNDWRPMGLRDALIFMVTGHAVGRVRRVDENMLIEHAMGAPMDVPPAWLAEYFRAHRQPRSWT